MHSNFVNNNQSFSTLLTQLVVCQLLELLSLQVQLCLEVSSDLLDFIDAICFCRSFVNDPIVDSTFVRWRGSHVRPHLLKLGLHNLAQLFVQKLLLPLSHQLFDSFVALPTHLCDLLLYRLLAKIKAHCKQVLLVFFGLLCVLLGRFRVSQNRLIQCLSIAWGHLLRDYVHLLANKVEVFLKRRN